MPAYRFTPPKNVFGSVEENPDNLCFCPQGPPCAPSGFFNVSLCQYGKFDHKFVITNQVIFFSHSDNLFKNLLVVLVKSL